MLRRLRPRTAVITPRPVAHATVASTHPREARVTGGTETTTGTGTGVILRTGVVTSAVPAPAAGAIVAIGTDTVAATRPISAGAGEARRTTLAEGAPRRITPAGVAPRRIIPGVEAGSSRSVARPTRPIVRRRRRPRDLRPTCREPAAMAGDRWWHRRNRHVRHRAAMRFPRAISPSSVRSAALAGVNLASKLGRGIEILRKTDKIDALSMI